MSRKRAKILAEHGWANYRLYLMLSPHWKAIREKKARSEKPKCYCCGSTKKIELHHRTYERVCNERLGDLVWLCQFHHAEVHKLARKGKVGLGRAHKHLRDQIRGGKAKRKKPEKKKKRGRGRSFAKTQRPRTGIPLDLGYLSKRDDRA